MQAWLVEALGQPPRLVKVPLPVPGPGEVLVRVAAAGLNFADLLMAEGRYQDRITPPFIPGLELAGIVEAAGPDTMAPPPGTPVAAHVRCGAFADHALVPADRLVLLPADMPPETAAGFLIACGTAHLALRKAAIAAGETLFVTGAAGGVGLAAVEIGHRLGARVIASARGAEKAAIARAAGAAAVIDSDSADLLAKLRALGGVDVTFDTVGGPGFEAALRATRPGGRMLAIGFAGGEVPRVALNQLLVRNVSVIGLWWGGYLSFAPQQAMASLEELLEWWRNGSYRPQPPTVLPFAQLPAGLEALRARRARGKIVLATGARLRP